MLWVINLLMNLLSMLIGYMLFLYGILVLNSSSRYNFIIRLLHADNISLAFMTDIHSLSTCLSSKESYCFSTLHFLNHILNLKAKQSSTNEEYLCFNINN